MDSLDSLGSPVSVDAVGAAPVPPDGQRILSDCACRGIGRRWGTAQNRGRRAPGRVAQEASALLGVSTATLRRWAADGRVATFTTPGGHRRIRRSAVEALFPRRPTVA